MCDIEGQEVLGEVGFIQMFSGGRVKGKSVVKECEE